MTMISQSERNALHRALVSGEAAKVERIELGVYHVPSASKPSTVYTVTGYRLDGADLRCNCKAGERGIACHHKAAVRLRKVQEEALRQGRRLTRRPSQMAAAPERVAATPANPLEAERERILAWWHRP